MDHIKIECGHRSTLEDRRDSSHDDEIYPVLHQRSEEREVMLCDQLSAVADEVASGVSGLDAVNATSVDELQEVLRTLSTLEAQVMQVLAAFTALVESLEQASERDEANEPAYALVIDAAAGMLNSFEKAKSATEALREILSGRA